ncbi:DUF2939 domain-containing protein [Methylobacterium platani]|uniref:DUF2939 domain-containing protein n=2 Tax=Methylobacterium platani TaxID=427683 RepID=A0A179SB10_9HYPH|nr:DUF2939 domain-containing protein [Methylobacterium platani]KMO21825.1 hypothetical protein SQ03_02375 [Methylobacterium platani JCM 14648]OAS24973.1 hypothetical protein A5481_11750 [Methylobacterium platani]
MTRWWLCGLGVVLLWVAYGLSPYIALYRLSQAVQAHDAAAVAQRVNFRTLRLSLTKQALAAAVDAIAARRDLSARDRAILTEASGALAEPLVESLVTPETLIDLLDDGWPVRAGLARDGAARERAADTSPPGNGTTVLTKVPRQPPTPEWGAGKDGLGLHASTLGQLFALFRSAEPRGFRGIVVSYPPDRPLENRFRLRLRLRGWTWRLVDLELPGALRERISQRLTGAMQR